MSIAILLANSGCRDEGDSGQAERQLVVPTARLLSSAARRRGRALFVEHCALCHGERADGRGQRREGFARPPRDFTDVAWRAATSPGRVFAAIREGVHGTAMPAWRVFDDDETWDLVAYVLAVSEKSE